MNYAEIRDQFNDTFANDYSLVGHPELLPVSPFVSQVEPRYNLTLLPPKPEEWYQGMEKVEKVVIACMDKDVSPQIRREPTRAVITIAGGVIQHGHREDVLRDFMGLLADDIQDGKYPNLHKVSVSGHNHVCGYVGYELGQKLPQFLGCEPRSSTETAYTRRLVAHGAKTILAPLTQLPTDLKINVGVWDTQRSADEPPASYLKFDPQDCPPLSIADLLKMRQ